ncbi:MAG: hypothetical protein M1378_08990 [Bacteroidetes bacterium]|jgi:hypothetical protein|nr:hypothetical protein [Bacteroidota bacterium]MCL5035318.1 hypothetical protein [Bacteroidota bacterium]
MKNVLVLLAMIAAASAVAVLMAGNDEADTIVEGADDDSLTNYLGV